MVSKTIGHSLFLLECMVIGIISLEVDHMKKQCIRCVKGHKTLTEKGHCAYCHKEMTGEWAFEFSDRSRKK
jgi:hypothetical protein